MASMRSDGDAWRSPAEGRIGLLGRFVCLLFGLALALILFRVARSGGSWRTVIEILACSAPLIAAFWPVDAAGRLWSLAAAAGSLLILFAEAPGNGVTGLLLMRIAAAGFAASVMLAIFPAWTRPRREPVATSQAPEFLAALLAGSGDRVILCDANGRILMVSAAIERDSGFAAAELGGQPLSALIGPGGVAGTATADGAGALESGASETGRPREVALRRRNGGSFAASLTARNLHDDAGRRTGAIAFLADRSMRQGAAEESGCPSELDILTGLPNRPGMVRHIGRMLLEDRANTGPHGKRNLALILVDVDDLKQVNDRFGHAIGDFVLRQFADRLRSGLDAADFLARQSGDEFALVLAGPDAGRRARALAERLHREIASPFLGDYGQVHLRASVGMAVCPEDAADSSALIAAADQALFVAKSSGGNRIVAYDDEIGRRARDRLRLMDELQEGLARGELRLLYQPVVDLSSGRIVKAEALVRWQHPDLGLLRSGRFIPLAEEGRMIDAIGGWVLAQCCSDLPVLRERFGPEFQLSANVSPKQLSGGTPEEFAALCALVAQAAETGRGLILEITETALLNPAPAMIARLIALQQAGAQIALDDFGAGHTSLRYYLTHDFEYLKIDRAFLRDAPQNSRAVAICETILGFADRLGATAIAEGIETEAQVEMLRKIGCGLGQGYLFAQPLSLSDLVALPLHWRGHPPRE